MIRAGTTEPGDIQELIDAIRQAGLMIKRVLPIRPSLEDLFMEAVTDSATGRSVPVGAVVARQGAVMPVLPMLQPIEDRG
jgi:hypothetical protein